MEIGDYAYGPFLQKQLLKRLPHAQIQSQVKSRQKRRIISAKLMKYNQCRKEMTLVHLLIDGMFSSELFYVNICIWLYHFM